MKHLLCTMAALVLIAGCQLPMASQLNSPSDKNSTSYVAPPSAPPTNVSAVSGNAQAIISWTAASGATSYNLYYSTTTGVTVANGKKVAGVTSPYTLTGLTNGTTYYLVVTAADAGGESASSTQTSVLPQVPVAGAPTGVSAAAGNAQATVTWTAVAGTSSYNLYYSTTTGVTASSGTKVTNVTSPYVLSGLTNGTTYYIIVTAVTSGGEAASSQVSTTVNPQYTLTITMGTGGMSFTPSSPDSVYSGVATNISATAAATYSFVNWTVVTGTATFGNANSATTTVTLSSGNATIQANFALVGTIFTVVGNGTAGFLGDGGTATSAELNQPYNVAVDSSGNLYIADQSNFRIRKMTASTGLVSTIAGNGIAGYTGDGGAATSAEISTYVYGIAADSSGNTYFSDFAHHIIRKVTALTGLISTIVGTGTPGSTGDGGAATAAEIYQPYNVAVDASGNIFIADESTSSVRKVTASTGFISTVAGNGSSTYSGDGGPATAAGLVNPTGVAIDSANNIFIADETNSRVRKVTSSTGFISTVAGNGTDGYSGDGAAATSGEFYNPSGVAVDSAGNLYVVDVSNERIRKVSASTGFISTVAGTGVGGYSGDGGPATSAMLNTPYSIAIDAFGNLYFADTGNNRIRKVVGSGGGVGP